MITLAYMRDFPPFTQQTSDGPTGLAINRVRAALAAAGIEATFKPVDLPEAIPALTAGVVDAIAATGAAPERADVLSYSDPLLTTGGAWFLRAGTQWPADGDLEKPSNNPARVVPKGISPVNSSCRRGYSTK